MSLRVVPETTHTSSFTHNSSHSAPSAPGLHDTLRAGVGPSANSTALPASQPTASSAHPLESRLRNWEATQEAMRMEVLRRTYGMAAPIRIGMELKIARDTTWRPAALGGDAPTLHEDILRGRDEMITWEDIFTGEDSKGLPGFHDEMERKLRM